MEHKKPQEQKYFTVPVLAKKQNCSIDQIFYLLQTDQLTAYVLSRGYWIALGTIEEDGIYNHHYDEYSLDKYLELTRGTLLDILSEKKSGTPSFIVLFYLFASIT